MPIVPRRHHVARTLFALLLAAVASVRGGGVALACESLSASRQTSMAMNGSPMAEHVPLGREGCPEPERAGDCALMAACAPALSPASPEAVTTIAASMTALPWRARLPAPVDRSPEPPPPRA